MHAESADCSVPSAVKKRATSTKANAVAKTLVLNAESKSSTLARLSVPRRTVLDESDISCMIAEENYSDAPLVNHSPPVDQNSPAVKLIKVLYELIVAELEVSEVNCRRVEHIISDFLDTFVGLQFNVCRTHVIRHRIDTQDTPQFKERG